MSVTSFYAFKRKKYGLTLEDIAKEARCTKQNVCQFENGYYKHSRLEGLYDDKVLEVIAKYKYLKEE